MSTSSASPQEAVYAKQTVRQLRASISQSIDSGKARKKTLISILRLLEENGDGGVDDNESRRQALTIRSANTGTLLIGQKRPREECVAVKDAGILSQQPSFSTVPLPKVLAAAKSRNHCAVCLEDSPDIALTCCSCLLHMDCAAQWMAGNPQCMQCRRHVVVPKLMTAVAVFESMSLKDPNDALGQSMAAPTSGESTLFTNVEEAYGTLCNRHEIAAKKNHLWIDPMYIANRQPELSDRMRKILIDWLVDIAAKFRLKRETLFLAVNIIDRFATLQPVSRKDFQKLGATAVMIAANTLEVKSQADACCHIPDASAISDVTAKSYTAREIEKYKRLISDTLRNQFTNIRTSLQYLTCLLEQVNAPGFHKVLSMMMLEVALHFQAMLQFPDAVIACAAYVVAVLTAMFSVMPSGGLRSRWVSVVWNDELQKISGGLVWHPVRGSGVTATPLQRASKLLLDCWHELREPVRRSNGNLESLTLRALSGKYHSSCFDDNSDVFERVRFPRSSSLQVPS